jgi:hypothetical protein
MTRQNLPDWPSIHKSKRGNKFHRHGVWKIMMRLLRLGMIVLFGVLAPQRRHFGTRICAEMRLRKTG